MTTLHDEKTQAEIYKMIVEMQKMNAETQKMNVETQKIFAETLHTYTNTAKIYKEIIFYPLVIASGLIGAIALVLKTFFS